MPLRAWATWHGYMILCVHIYMHIQGEREGDTGRERKFMSYILYIRYTPPISPYLVADLATLPAILCTRLLGLLYMCGCGASAAMWAPKKARWQRQASFVAVLTTWCCTSLLSRFYISSQEGPDTQHLKFSVPKSIRGIILAG